MKVLSLLAAMIAIFVGNIQSQGYQIGDQVEDFKLKNVDGRNIGFSDFPDAKGFIVIFTCNHCPYAKLYESRIIKIAEKYSKQGFQLLAINPNDPTLEPEDSFENMVHIAKKKKYPFPYLFDEKQSIFPKFGAKRTPQVFIVTKERILKYNGAIDDFPKDESGVKLKYVENALDALKSGKDPDPSITKAVGCGIKAKS